MPTFNYTGYTSNGKKVKGVKDAESVVVLRKELASSGILLEDVSEVSRKKRRKSFVFAGFTLKKQIGTLFFQLSLLLKGGIPLVDAIKIVGESSKSISIKGILLDIASKVAEGQRFSAVLEEYEWLFGKIYISLIKTSESVGRLADVLMDIASYEERKTVSKSKITSALIYPFTVLLIGFGVVGFLLGYVVPKMEKVFASVHRQLPIITRILIEVGNFLKTYGVYLVGFLLSLFVLFEVLYFRNKRFKFKIDRWLYSITFFKNAYLARFSETLAFQLKEGLVLTEALTNTANVVGNEFLRGHLIKMADRINSGESFSNAAKNESIFPQILIASIKTGEKSGNLSDVLFKTGQFFDKYVDVFTSRFVSLIEPVFIVFIGFVVGFIVMSIMIPLFEINTFIK